MSLPKRRYEGKVQEKTLEFLDKAIEFNFHTGEIGFSLDMTMGEAKMCFAANKELIEAAQTGALKELYAQF
jgi:hypothetical protein